MFVINSVTGDIFKVIERVDADSVIIDYYDNKMLLHIGEVWKFYEMA